MRKVLLSLVFVVLFSCAFVIAHAEIGDVIHVNEFWGEGQIYNINTYVRKNEKNTEIMKDSSYTGTWENMYAIL